MPTLKPSKYAEEHVGAALSGRFGEALADCFSINDGHVKDLYQSSNANPSSAEHSIKRKLGYHHPWDSLTISHLRVILCFYSDSTSDNFSAIFDAQKSLVSDYNDWFRSDNTAWSLPVLYVIYRDLRVFAMRADETLISRGQKPVKLAEAARLIQVGFGLCCSDVRVLSFLQEDYEKAEEHLYFAFNNCHRNKHKNRNLIMNYLVPLRLLNGKRAIPALLNQFNQLSDLYQPFIIAVRLGNVEMFDRHLVQVERQLMKRGTYLIVERCRDVCLCNFVKLIHRLKSGSHQIPLDLFRKIAYEVQEEEAEEEDIDFKLDEVECLLANLIAQDRVRGYIHHQAKMLVLSKLDAFPAQTVIRGY
ncbi:hypothetical protein PSTT_02505, partial [Puccinia striiformis]